MPTLTPLLSEHSTPCEGMLVINKPRGVISKDVSRSLKPFLPRDQKFGHVGTLDPMAEGVLPLLFGRATRLQDYLISIPKTYEFLVRLGVETDTLDADGKVIATEPVPPLIDTEILKVLESFKGPIEQTPPLFSAVKFQGRALHYYARHAPEKAKTIGIQKKKVHIYSLTLQGIEGEDGLRIAVECSKGTYVRSLARDIAARLGTVGTVTELRRSSSAGYNLTQSMSLKDLLEEPGRIRSEMVPISQINLQMPTIRGLADHDTRKLKFGQALKLPKSEFPNFFGSGEGAKSSCTQPDVALSDIALYDSNHRFIGIGKASEHCLKEFSLACKRGIS